jgi:hypothetical protein
MTIQKTKGGKFIVKSKKGKNLSKPVSKAKARKRLRQVEHFKRKKG